MSGETSRCVERAALPAPEGIRGRVISGALWWLRLNWLFHAAAAATAAGSVFVAAAAF